MLLKENMIHATVVDTSYLAAKKDFIALKADVNKVDINKLVNVSTSLYNLKIRVDDLDIHDLKNLRDVVNKEVVKNTKFNKLNIKVNKLDEKIPDATTLIHINQCNTDKQNLEKKWRCW